MSRAPVRQSHIGPERPERWHYAGDLVYAHRHKFAFLLALAILLQLVLLAVTILGAAAGGIVPRDANLPTVTLSEEVEGLLATGTIALAYAALVQASSNPRLADLTFHPNPLLVVFSRRPEADGPHPDPIPSGSVVAVRNLGPGIAKGLEIRWYRSQGPEESRSFAEGHRPPVGPPEATEERAYLDTERGSCWVVQAPAGSEPREYLVTLSAKNVFGTSVTTSRYLLSAEPESADPPGAPPRTRWTLVYVAEGPLR